QCTVEPSHQRRKLERLPGKWRIDSPCGSIRRHSATANYRSVNRSLEHTFMDTIKFNTWADFRTWIDADRQTLPVYWRGQATPDWPLASSSEREILRSEGGTQAGAAQLYPYDGRFQRNGKAIWAEGFYQSLRDRYLAAFKSASAGLRGPNPSPLSG